MQTTAAVPSQRRVEAPSAAYAASLQQAFLLRRKIDSLSTSLADTMAQLLTCANREYQAGRLDMDGLADLYAQVRLLGPGFSKVWDANMDVVANSVRAFVQLRSTAVPPTALRSYWAGPYPYDRSPRPRKGISVVYVLYDAANEPIYLGSSGDFPGRMRWHRNDGKPIAWWLAYPCESREAAYLLEGGLLAARKPPLNVKVGR